MKIDLAKLDAERAKLDARLKKIDDLRRFASDAESMAMLEAMLVNGNGPTDSAASAASLAEPTVRPPWKEGTQVAAIAKAALACEKPFSGYDLAQKMQESGHKFGAAKPGLTVCDVLRNTLLKKGAVRVFKKGHGSEPMLFERVLPQH